MNKVILILVIFLSYTTLYANPQIKKLIKTSGDANKYPGKSELIIFDSTKVAVQESGLSYVHIHKLTKILSTDGAKKNAVIKFGYDPLSAYVDVQGVYIYHKSGKVTELDMTKVMDYPAPARAIYWGAREKMVDVGRLEPGDAIEVFMFRKGFTYALLQEELEDEMYIPPMRGHYYDIVEFWSANPVFEKVYQLKLPKDKTLQYEFYNGEARSSVKPEGDYIIYTFSKSDYTQPKREPGMVASSDEFPKLLLSTSPDWFAKSTWFYGVNENFGSFESTPTIDAKVDEILLGAESEMDSVARLTHWVADNIRYSGISMGCGEGFTLHKGEMTFSDRCGVCKDKAGMLITMLRAAGFESYAAMTMAGSRIDYIPADQFNHSVTIVKLADSTYQILDPTWVPFVRELWSSLEQQQNYLMGIPEGADLMITPISDPKNHYLKIKGSSEIKPDGTLIGEFTIDAEGQSDAAIRRMFTSNYISNWNRAMENELLSVHPRAVITDKEYSGPYSYMAEPLHIQIKYKIPDYAIVTENEIIFTPLVVSNIFKRAMSHLYFKTDIVERQYQFRDRCSRYIELSETISLPDSVSVTYLPEIKMVSGTGASIKGGFGLENKTLSVGANLTFNKRIYDPEDWGSFREVVATQQKLAEEPIILNIKN